MQDVFVRHPGWFQTLTRESRIDSYATGMWLFHSGAEVRDSARDYVRKLR